MMKHTPANISIFAELKRQLSDKIPINHLTKATLTHLSHVLEDVVIRERLPALIFTGFQESSHWRTETRRYEEIAQVATQTVIFAGKPIPEDQNFSGLRIQLASGDPLRQEWFLLILSTKFAVVLAGLDQLEAVGVEAHRKFEFIWSFDAEIVSQVVDILETIVAQYRPDMVPKLQQARQDFPLVDVSSELLTQFSYELLRMEDILFQEMARQNRVLLKKDAQIQSILKKVPMSIVEVAKNGRILNVTGMLAKSLGDQYGFVVGNSIFKLKADKFDDLPPIFADALAGKEGGTFHSFAEYELQLVELNQPLEQPDKVALAIVIFDVSERIEKEVLQVEYLKEVEMSQLRRQLMITLSHELRTPLMLISTSFELLDRFFDQLTTQRREKLFSRIEHQMGRLKAIMDDINQVITSESKPFGEGLQWIDLTAHCRQLVEELSHLHANEIVAEIDEEMTHVYTDPRVFTYILTNLLNNSAKYSGSRVQIGCLIRETANEIVIQVTDSGIGIPKEEIQRVTDPFYRGSNTEFVPGTGLGLSIIKSLVNSYGGHMAITSEMGQGTTVTVSLKKKSPPA